MTTRHEMTLVAHRETEDEWYCPTCGRRMIVKYGGDNPGFDVLIEGDPTIQHGGSTGGLTIKSIAAVEEQSDPHLEPFEEWYKKNFTGI